MRKFDLTFIKQLLDLKSEDRIAFFNGQEYLGLSAEKKNEFDQLYRKEISERTGAEMVGNLNANVNAEYIEYKKELLGKIREHNIEVLPDSNPFDSLGQKWKVYMMKPERNFYLCEANSGFDAAMIVDALRFLANDDIKVGDIDINELVQDRMRNSGNLQTKNRPNLTLEEQSEQYKKFREFSPDELEEYFLGLTRLEKVEALKYLVDRKNTAKLLWRMWSADYYDDLEGPLEQKYHFKEYLLSQLLDPSSSIVVLPIVDSNTLNPKDWGLYIETPDSFIKICQGSGKQISFMKEALILWINNKKTEVS